MNSWNIFYTYIYIYKTYAITLYLIWNMNLTSCNHTLYIQFFPYVYYIYISIYSSIYMCGCLFMDNNTYIVILMKFFDNKQAFTTYNLYIISLWCERKGDFLLCSKYICVYKCVTFFWLSTHSTIYIFWGKSNNA